MSKKKTVKPSEKDLHEIKNKKRLRAVKDKKRGVRLKRVSRRKAKALVSVSLVAVVALGIFGLGAFGNPEKNVVDPGFGTVSFVIPTDGSTPDQHTGIENIGYMNTRFMSQTDWYAEMHSSVDTIMSQTVDTYKQFSRGILIQLDIAKSSLINEAQQFCWTDSDVLWRTTTRNVSSWTGIDMPWSDFDLQHRTIYDYVYEDRNGLPGTAFSVYVLREETVLDAEPVIVNADGTYSQTFHLNPEKDMAPAHYGNQMVFKGGLSAPPSFDYITVTYTFDSTWQVLVCEVEEKYTATKSGIPIPASCVSTSVTKYEYKTEKANHTAYDDYFQYHLDSPITGNPSDGTLTAVECLGAAFAPMLSEPTTLALSLDLNGYTLNGLIAIDVTTMDIRADFQNGAIRFWYSDGEAYLAYGGLKIKLKMNEVLALFGETATEESGEGGGLSLDSILADLAQGEFTLGESTASLSSVLDLSDFIGISIPVDFNFVIGEGNSVTLDELHADLVFDGLTLGATLRFSEEKLPDLPDADKSAFIDFSPYIKSVYGLAQEDVLRAVVTYRNGGIDLNGEVNLSYKDGLSLAGAFTLTYNGSVKTLSFAYLGETVYLDLDGIRISASGKEAAEIVGGFIGELNLGNGGMNVTAVLQTLFAEDFMSALSLAEENETLTLSVKATQILQLLGAGIEIDGLNEVNLSVAQNGVVSLSALGATVSVAKGEEVSFDTDGYIDVLPYLRDVVDIFTGEAVEISLDYQSEKIALNGTVTVNTGAALQVQGAVTLTYQGADIPVGFYYSDGEIYLDIYGLKVKTDTDSLLGLVSGSGKGTLGGVFGSLFGGEQDLTAIGNAVADVMGKLFSVETSELFGLSESDGVLNFVVNGTKLLNLFGSDFELGNVTVSIQKDLLAIRALDGLNVEIKSGNAVSIGQLNDYIDVSDTLALVSQAVENGSLSIGGTAEFAFGETEISVAAKGLISWKEGFVLYLDILLDVNGAQQNIILKADSASVQMAYGTIGVNVAFEELDTLGEAFVKLYGTLKSVLDQAFVQESPIPEIENINDLFDLLEGVIKAKGLLPENGGEFNVGALLQSISILSPDTENGICKITYHALIAELVKTPTGLGIQFRYDGEEFSVSANLEASALTDKVPEMPADVVYLTVDDFVVMLDYVGAAVKTLAENDVKVTIFANTYETAEGRSTVNDVNGTILYHTGGDVLFTVDTEEKTLTVTTNLYLNVSLSVVSDENSFYFDLLVFDFGDDGMLDFFVTLSRFDVSDTERYAPLKIYAPADEVMTVLSAGLSVLGINPEFLNQYMIGKWLGVKTPQQLLAFGSMLEKSLGLQDGLLGLLSALKGSGSQNNVAFESVIRSITAGKDVFNVTLNSASVYGIDGLNDVIFEISKGEDGFLKGISLNNVYNGSASQVTDVEIGIYTDFSDEAVGPQSLEGYFNVTGVGALLKAIANTATHEVTGADGNSEYVMNENFYIEGMLSVKLTAVKLVDINIDVKIAVSVDLDKEGDVLVKVRLNYDGKSVPLFGTAINGDTNQLDLAIDLADGMVYMKRIETTDKKDTVEYRAMPLNVFAQDILNQIGFMLNFGSLIMNYLPENLATEGETEIVDFGAMLSAYLSGFDCAGNETEGYTWKITLNGTTLTGGAMGDIVVTISTMSDGEGNPVLRTLGLATTVSTGSSVGDAFVSISISTGNTPLTILNPQGVMDSGKTDVLREVNLPNDLTEAIGKAFAEAEANDWTDEEGNYIYISGVLTTVTYILGDVSVGTQKVLIDGKTNELCAELNYPDFTTPEYSEYRLDGYTIVWNKPETISPNQMIYAEYVANRYSVMLVSEKYLEGWSPAGNGYVLEATYVYSDGLYCNGAKIGFPDADMNGWFIQSFTDENGNVYYSFDDCRTILSDTVLTANWAKVDYTISYDVNGMVSTQTAHYGDGFVCDLNTVRDGYTLTGWTDENGNSYPAEFEDCAVTGSVKLTAVYTPNVYNVTLVSGYEIDGFESADGVWMKTIVYTFGSQIKLPSGIETADGHFLNGFTIAGQSEVYVYLPEVAYDVTLEANWSAVNYKITYILNGKNYAVHNYEYGDALVLPAFDGDALAFKTGYEPYWVVDEDYRVTASDTVYGEYRAKTYTVSVHSDYDLGIGFFASYEEVNGKYVYTYLYTYDTPAVTLPSEVNKVPKFDFIGYFTAQNGGGTQVTAIDNAIVSDTELYVYWLDNTVTVTFCSDYGFDGSVKDLTTYKKTVLLNDEYTLNVVMSAGYKQLGWFYHDNGSWTMLSDVSAFKGQSIELHALWIQEVKVNIDDFYTNDYKVIWTFKRYNAVGTVSGGIVSGKQSAAIADAIGLEGVPEATFTVGSDENFTKSSNLSWGSSSKLVYNEEGVAPFGIYEQNCADFNGRTESTTASYGKVEITIKFTYGNTTITTNDVAVSPIRIG